MSKLDELDKARRVIARHEAAQRKAAVLKRGDVRYVTYRGDIEACVYHVRAIDGLPPATIEALIRAIPGVGVSAGESA